MATFRFHVIDGLGTPYMFDHTAHNIDAARKAVKLQGRSRIVGVQEVTSNAGFGEFTNDELTAYIEIVKATGGSVVSAVAEQRFRAAYLATQ